MGTRTGDFPIGFRRGRGWQDNIETLTRFAVDTGFEAIDLGEATESDIASLRAAGLRVGTCDVLGMGDLFADDESLRKETVARNVEYIKKLTGLGVERFFTAVCAKDPYGSRAKNFDLAVASFRELAPLARELGAMIVIEGWPGGDPCYPNVCCNPETYRRIFKEVDSSGLGVNYDPSHLIRMGIDHIRFLAEFLPHVGHVHAKDTEILTEAVYEYGIQQASAFVPWGHYGESYWRYTIPGHGQARWVKIFEMLVSIGWQGIVSVELEDDHFRGSQEAEMLGFTHSMAFLKTA